MAVLDQTGGARNPAAATGEFTASHEPKAQPEGIPDRPWEVIGAEGFLVSPRKKLRGFVGPANQLGGEREMLEIVEVKCAFDGGRRQLLVGLGPGPPFERLSPELEGVDAGHRHMHPGMAGVYAPSMWPPPISTNEEGPPDEIRRASCHQSPQVGIKAGPAVARAPDQPAGAVDLGLGSNRLRSRAPR